MDYSILEYAQEAAVVLVVFIFVKFISEMGKAYIARKRAPIAVNYVCQVHTCPNCGCEFRSCVIHKRRDDEVVFTEATQE